MDTQCEATFKALGWVITIQEIENWVNKTYGAKWKDFGTSLADMVPRSKGGNESYLGHDYFQNRPYVFSNCFRLIPTLY